MNNNHHVYKVGSFSDADFGVIYFHDYEIAVSFASDYNESYNTYVTAIDLGFQLPFNKMDLHDFFVFLNDPNVKFEIAQTNETGEDLWIVIPSNDPEFWMGSWGTYDEALDFIKKFDLLPIGETNSLD